MPAPLKVLYVEDEALIRLAIAEGLGDLGLDVVEAADVSDALKQAESDPSIHFLVTDFRLPDGTGADLVKKLRQTGNHIPVLVVSGNTADWADAIKTEPQYYEGIEVVSKPIHHQDIYNKIIAIAALYPHKPALDVIEALKADCSLA